MIKLQLAASKGFVVEDVFKCCRVRKISKSLSQNSLSIEDTGHGYQVPRARHEMSVYRFIGAHGVHFDQRHWKKNLNTPVPKQKRLQARVGSWGSD